LSKSESDRRALAKAVFRLFDHWQLEESEQLALLGIDETAAGALAAMRDQGVLDPSTELTERALALLRIFRFLGMLFPDHPDLARRWMRTPQPRLDERAALDAIKLQGMQGIKRVTVLLEEQLF
jgi:hypothetical protein